MPQAIDAVHDYWFGELDETGMSPPELHKLWFQSSTDDDSHCANAFGALVEDAVAGGLQDWESNDRGLVALVVLLDQFTRNIYRGTPAAFSGDARALALAQHCIVHGHHQRLAAIHQVFVYLPLEHTENLDVQEECVSLFEELAGITGLAQIADFTRYAVAHRDVIARFGRFPHRNAILGRTSTAEELDYLATNGGF